MDSKIKYVAVAVIAVAIIAAAAFVVLKDKDDSKESFVEIEASLEGGIYSVDADSMINAANDAKDKDGVMIAIDSKDATEISLSVPVSGLIGISDNKIPLVIDSKLGKITLDVDTLSAFTGTNAVISMKTSDISESNLPKATKELYKDYEIVSVDIIIDDVAVHDLGGTAKVSVPYTVESYSSKNSYYVTMFFVDDENNATPVDATYDGKNVVFSSEHFSNYIFEVTEKKFEPIIITTSDGKRVTINSPATKICLTNSNEAEIFQILGGEKYIVAMMEGAFEEQLNTTMQSKDKLAKYSSVTAAAIAKTGCQYVISPATSMALPLSVQTELKSTYGIITLGLDCYGENMIQDVQQLAKLLNDDSCSTKANEYIEMHKSIRDKVYGACTADDTKTFLSVMCSKTVKYYTDTAENVKKIEAISGKNAMTDMGVSQGTSATLEIDASIFYNYDKSGKLDYLFLRSQTGKTLAESYGTWLKSGPNTYYNDSNMPVASTKGGIYVIQTDAVSGCRDFIGDVIYAELMGFDTGLDAVELMNEFNNKYGFTPKYDKDSENNTILYLQMGA